MNRLSDRARGPGGSLEKAKGEKGDAARCLVDTLDRMQKHRRTANVLLLLPANVDLLTVRTVVVERTVSHHLFVDLLVEVRSVDPVVQHLGFPYVTEVDRVRREDTLERQWQVVCEASFGIERVIVRHRQLRVKHQCCGPSLAMKRLLGFSVDNVHRLQQGSTHAHVGTNRGTTIGALSRWVVLHVVLPVPARASWIEDRTESDQVSLIAASNGEGGVVAPVVLGSRNVLNEPSVVLVHTRVKRLLTRILLDTFEEVEVVANVADVHLPVVHKVVLLVVEVELLQCHEARSVRSLREHVVQELSGQSWVESAHFVFSPELDETPELAWDAGSENVESVPFRSEDGKVTRLDFDENAYIVWRVGVIERKLADQSSHVENVVLAPGVALVGSHDNGSALSLGSSEDTGTATGGVRLISGGGRQVVRVKVVDTTSHAAVVKALLVAVVHESAPVRVAAGAKLLAEYVGAPHSVTEMTFPLAFAHALGLLGAVEWVHLFLLRGGTVCGGGIGSCAVEAGRFGSLGLLLHRLDVVRIIVVVLSLGKVRLELRNVLAVFDSKRLVRVHLVSGSVGHTLAKVHARCLVAADQGHRVGVWCVVDLEGARGMGTPLGPRQAPNLGGVMGREPEGRNGLEALAADLCAPEAGMTGYGSTR